jgi:hypothetical protein
LRASFAGVLLTDIEAYCNQNRRHDMTNISEELKARVEVLELIDRRRVETDDPTFGSAIERMIIDHCLAELERDANTPYLVRANLDGSWQTL